MNIKEVKHDIDTWIQDFLAVPTDRLSGWSPCPYAHVAVKYNSYQVFIGTDLETDIQSIKQFQLKKNKVIVIVYDKHIINSSQFFEKLEHLNQTTLVSNDIIALGDHPDEIEQVNGVNFNQGKYSLVLLQQLSDLNKKAKTLMKQGFYDYWPHEYLDDIFMHRENPRTENI